MIVLDSKTLRTARKLLLDLAAFEKLQKHYHTQQSNQKSYRKHLLTAHRQPGLSPCTPSPPRPGERGSQSCPFSHLHRPTLVSALAAWAAPSHAFTSPHLGEGHLHSPGWGSVCVPTWLLCRFFSSSPTSWTSLQGQRQPKLTWSPGQSQPPPRVLQNAPFRPPPRAFIQGVLGRPQLRPPLSIAGWGSGALFQAPGCPTAPSCPAASVQPQGSRRRVSWSSPLAWAPSHLTGSGLHRPGQAGASFLKGLWCRFRGSVRALQTRGLRAVSMPTSVLHGQGDRLERSGPLPREACGAPKWRRRGGAPCP